MTNPFIEKAKTKFNPNKPRSEQKLTPRKKTFINIYNEPKRKGIKRHVIEFFVTDDRKVPCEKFDAAAKDYAHRIGVVVYTEEEFKFYTQEPKRNAKDDTASSQKHSDAASR